MKVMVFIPGANTKEDWLVSQITALVFWGDGEADLDKAELLTDYYVHHLDGQEGYELGGEGG